MILDPATGHSILFIEVPDDKSTKNRIHFDLRPREGTRDEEVERVRALGATEVGDQRGKYGPGTGWVVLADPEGNEFCILRSQAEVDGVRLTPDTPPARQIETIGPAWDGPGSAGEGALEATAMREL